MTTEQTTKVYNQAFAYFVNGYNIMPIGKDKKPLLFKWKHLQTERVTEEQIKKWFIDEFPEANIAIITGEISGLTVIDVDTYKQPNTSPTVFPPTFTIKTGNGGFQLYYQYQPGLTISAEGYANLPAVDIRSDGGYVVAPPSITDYIDNGKKVGGEYLVYKNLPMVA